MMGASIVLVPVANDTSAAELAPWVVPAWFERSVSAIALLELVMS